MRLLGIFLGLAVLLLIPFLLWGEEFEFTLQGAIGRLQDYGAWAWGIGILLLMGDLLLPIPATVVMSALGYLYGPLIGSLLGSIGSITAGLLGYGLCRGLGRRAAVVIAGEKGLSQGERLFAQYGGWLIVLSRWMPLLQEAVACMAGLTRMRFGPFLLALACGSIPMAITFALIGHAGVEHPVWAIALSAGVPPLVWLGIQLGLRLKAGLSDRSSSDNHGNSPKASIGW